MKKCPFCAEKIQDAAIVCKHCRRDLRRAQGHTPAQPPDLLEAPKSRKTSFLALGCLGLVVTLWLLGLIGRLGQEDSAASPTQATAPSNPSDARALLYAQSDGAKVRNSPREDALVVRELALAERVVSVSRVGEWVKLKGTDEQWVHSSLLGPHRPETALEKVERLAAQAAAEEKRAAADRMAAKVTREVYAKKIREIFLDQGFDIKVQISGAQSDRLVYEFVLFNDVWSHRFRKNGLIDQAAKLGFKRVEMKDGYDWHLYWDL